MPSEILGILCVLFLVLPTTLQAWWYYISVQMRKMRIREGKEQF